MGLAEKISVLYKKIEVGFTGSETKKPDPEIRKINLSRDVTNLEKKIEQLRAQINKTDIKKYRKNPAMQPILEKILQEQASMEIMAKNLEQKLAAKKTEGKKMGLVFEKTPTTKKLPKKEDSWDIDPNDVEFVLPDAYENRQRVAQARRSAGKSI